MRGEKRKMISIEDDIENLSTLFSHLTTTTRTIIKVGWKNMARYYYEHADDEYNPYE